MKLRTWHEILMEDLKNNPKEAAGYLNINFEDHDNEYFLVALHNIVKANGGFLKLSRKTKLNRANLYRAFSKKGNPEIMTINKVLNAMGLRLNVSVMQKKKNKKPPRQPANNLL